MDGRKYSTNYTDRKLLPETFGQMVSSSVRHTRSWTIGVLRAQARGIPIRRQSGGVVQVHNISRIWQHYKFLPKKSSQFYLTALVCYETFINQTFCPACLQRFLPLLLLLHFQLRARRVLPQSHRRDCHLGLPAFLLLLLHRI